MDTQLQQLRERIISTVTRRLLVGFAIAIMGAQVLLNGTSVSTDSSIRAVLAAELVVAFWLVTSMLLNPLGGRYLRRPAIDQIPPSPAKPDEMAPTRISDLGLPSLRSVATLASGGNATVDVFQTSDALVTVVLDPENDSIVAMSRLSDGRVFYTGELLIVPNDKVIVNLKHKVSAVDLFDSHMRLMRKLKSMELEFVPSSPAIALDVAAIEQRALSGLGSIAGVFLGMTGKSRFYRLLVSPSRGELLQMGLSYKQNPPLTPRLHSSVRSTDFRSNDETVSPSSS